MTDQEAEPIRVGDRLSRYQDGPGITWLLIIIVMALLAVAIMVLGGSTDHTPGPTLTGTDLLPAESHQPRIYTVSYDGGVFSPTNLRIRAGDTVRFKNESIFPIRIVSNDYVGFDSVGDIPQGSYFSFTFGAKGTFMYHNERNQNEEGTIIVR